MLSLPYSKLKYEWMDMNGEEQMEQNAKEYIATITSKGQVTIPVEVREQLRLAPQDKVVFRIVDGVRVEIEPLPMTLEEAYGSVEPLNRPENFETIKQIADEERAARWREKLKQ
jgi:AbrB family looped-hinge helix DNA binding protein